MSGVNAGSWAEWLVDNRFAPLGLKEPVLRQVREAREEGFPHDLVEWALEWIVELADENSRRHGKPVEHYVRRAVEKGSLLNYCRGLTRAAGGSSRG